MHIFLFLSYTHPLSPIQGMVLAFLPVGSVENLQGRLDIRPYALNASILTE